MTLYNGVTSQAYWGYYKNGLSQTASLPKSGAELWSPIYKFIFKTNSALDGLKGSTSLTPLVKQQLLGEAKFLRAFFYFYLVNLFGDVPLALTTDPKVTSLLARSSKEQIYQQIIDDLKGAQELLSDTYLDATLLTPTMERVRPTKWAATALLARTYLYNREWAKAEEQATIVINNEGLFGPISTVSLNNVFLKNSREAIWQIQPTAVNFNTQEARGFIITSTGPNNADNPVYLNSDLLNIFEKNDERSDSGTWVNSITVSGIKYFYPFKYKINSLDPSITPKTGTMNMKEYFMVLRLAEQYLIRSEAMAKQGKIVEAQTDLNTIRSRAGLGNTTAFDEASLLEAILHERQVELFTEWGHRWFDLKRSNKINEVMTTITPLKAIGSTWQTYQQLYPIPLSDIQGNPNLTQNLGY